MPRSLPKPTAATGLVAVLAGAGVMHFVTPKFFDSIVPRALPNPRFWTYLSGVAELGVAAAVANPSTRRLGGGAAAALFCAVYPANIQAVIDARTPQEKVAMWVRLPFQFPLIGLALRVRKHAR